MLKKIYENFINYIKYNYIFLIILFSIITVFQIDTGYSIYRPGGIIEINERVHVNGETPVLSGTLNMAYVSMLNATIPYHIIAWILPTWDLVPNTSLIANESENMEDVSRRSRINFEESISTAKYVAYQRANVPYNIASETNYIISIHENASSDFKIGDELLSVDEIVFDNIPELRDYLSDKEEGYEVEVIIKRDNQEIKIITPVFIYDNQKILGITISTIYNIDSQMNVTMDSEASESGPSGGMMLTLSIYAALTGKDITRGYTVVGTGTISSNGDIGEIGGIEHKISGAVRNNADIFLVAEANYERAIEYARERNYDIIIKSITTIDQAIEFLSNLEVKE